MRISISIIPETNKLREGEGKQKLYGLGLTILKPVLDHASQK